MTALIAKIIDIIPGLHLRASVEAEGLGMDDDQVRVDLSVNAISAYIS